MTVIKDRSKKGLKNETLACPALVPFGASVLHAPANVSTEGIRQADGFWSTGICIAMRCQAQSKSEPLRAWVRKVKLNQSINFW
jgi:hypothetical protein